MRKVAVIGVGLHRYGKFPDKKPKELARTAIEGALATPVGYIGVMGSRTTHARRMERLADVGVTDPADLDRLMSPIGLDIGARTPEETAISICAEIIAQRTGRGEARPLRDTDGPIHAEVASP